MSKSKTIKSYILDHIQHHPHDIVAKTIEKFKLSRTAVLRHLKGLIEEGRVVKTGTTRDISYHLASSLDKSIKFRINAQLSEHKVYEEHLQAIRELLPKNVEDICHYGFTEIFNNAIDHSQGTSVLVTVKIENNQLSLVIQDDGIGIFKKLLDFYGLEDIRDSILQLSKGKLTTDPTNHTGEGLFFTSRTFDTIEIFANGYKYIKDNLVGDWSFLKDPQKMKGTRISMVIALDSTRDIVEVFKSYHDEDSLKFSTTEVIVALSQYKQDAFISRSQAKRVLFNLDKFEKIVLDFAGIRLCGQGFADEIFRVYQTAHPRTQIQYINANDDISFMIERSLS